MKLWNTIDHYSKAKVVDTFYYLQRQSSLIMLLNINYLLLCGASAFYTRTAASDLLLSRHRFLDRAPNMSLPEISSVIVFRIPSIYLCKRNLDQAVRISAVLVDLQNLCPNGIALPLGNQVDPDNVVEIACNHTRRMLLSEFIQL